MAIMSSRLLKHEICKEELKDAGAKVIDIQGVMFHVSFVINSKEISYMYHLKPDNTFTLERVRPYFMQIGEYEREKNIVNAIKIDIEQFRNASKSSNFDRFIKVDKHLSQLIRIFEDLYLYYNISTEDLEELDTSIDNVLDTIKAITKRSDRAFYKKEPEILCDDVEFNDN